MPVLARLDWISRQLCYGRRVHMSYGHALDPSKLKIKIVLAPAELGLSCGSQGANFIFVGTVTNAAIKMLLH